MTIKIGFLTTVSAIALLSSVPVLAAPETKTQKDDTTVNEITSPDSKVEKTVTIAKVENVAASKQVKAMQISDNDAMPNETVTINLRDTASGVIGHNVYNEEKESIGKVSDIILDKDGKSLLLIVSEGRFASIGMGDKVAFDYDNVTRVESNGDVVLSLTEEVLEGATKFSYKKEDAGDQVSVMPENSYSVAELLGLKLVNQKNEWVGDIENISFKDGSTSQLVVSFGKTLGMGGDIVILPYKDAAIVNNEDKMAFQLSEAKASQLVAYKKSLTN